MNYAVRAILATLAACCVAPALAESAAPGDPSPAQIEAVLGPESIVQRTGPGQYVIDGTPASLRQLLDDTLPGKESVLRTMQDNIRQRQQLAAQVRSGVSIPAKRAQCQALAINSIERTRCYQELEDMRLQQNQSSEEQADQQHEDELQGDRLQQQIDAIEQFRKQYRGG